MKMCVIAFVKFAEIKMSTQRSNTTRKVLWPKRGNRISLQHSTVAEEINASTLTDEDKQDPEKLFKLFGDQLNTRVNFRIHRMELMTFYRQRDSETTDEFVNRARRQGKLCEFGAGELDERFIELIIATTPIEALQKHLLDQEKGYKVDILLVEDQKYEAMAVGRKTI